jgi:MFS family permease
MSDESSRIVRLYLTLTAVSTLAASLIWGVNTLFLLDAGLSTAGAFAANAFFTAGQVVFEIPTGVVADTRGRRTSYVLGAATLLVSTLAYLGLWHLEADLWAWALASALIGLGFTFFSGAVEAWLVDALVATSYDGDLESVFARGQVVAGVSMLAGSVAGGALAQLTNLGAPYIVRAVLLGVVVVIAVVAMRDEGFSPRRGDSPMAELRSLIGASLDHGWRNPPVRWLMLAAPFTSGAGVFAFYAMQPYLLELYGDDQAFGIAGLAAAIVAGAQIAGGFLVPIIRRVFRRRTEALMTAVAASVVALAGLAVVTRFWLALALLSVWAMAFAVSMPIRQAYVNGVIPSEQRATVLSFDALMGSSGGVVAQPALGRAADVWSYSASYALTSIITAAALPFLGLARRERSPSDPIVQGEAS